MEGPSVAESKRTKLSPEIEAVLRKYADYLLARCSLEETTIENYVGTMKRLLVITGPNPTPEQVTQYYADRRRAGLSYSYATYMTVGMERFMEMQGTPIALGRPPKPRRILKHVLSEAEITLLINAAGKNKRVRAILAVLAFSGARNEELCKIQMDDVDIGQNTIHISGKGAKDRKTCVTGTCMEAVVEYLQERRAAGATSTDPLFVTHRHGYPLEMQDVRKLVRVYAKKAGLRRRVYPHLLRHSLATNLMKRGMGLLTIRDQLGHEFLSSTITYLHTTVEDLKTEYRRNAPCYM